MECIEMYSELEYEKVGWKRENRNGKPKFDEEVLVY